MAPRNFQALAEAKIQRARALAKEHPASREALVFIAELVALQSRAHGMDEAELVSSLVELARQHGPQTLQAEAEVLTSERLDSAKIAYLEGESLMNPMSFFARAALQLSPPDPRSDSAPNRCPRCGQHPQVGCLRREGDGTGLSLECSVCSHEWPFARGRCPACLEESEGQLTFYSAEELVHLQVLACETCKRYLHVVDLEKDPRAIPAVDELLAFPMDIAMREKGLTKLHPNLTGI